MAWVQRAMSAQRRFLAAILCGMFGLLLLTVAVTKPIPSSSPLTGGAVIVSEEREALDELVRLCRRSVDDAVIVPVHFVGTYLTKAPKAYQRRLLMVLVADIRSVQRFLPNVHPIPTGVLGDGVPPNFSVAELSAWRTALRPFAHAVVMRLSSVERAFKWTVLLATDLSSLLPSKRRSAFKPNAVFILSPALSSQHLRRWARLFSTPPIVSLRIALRPANAFWTAWLGIVLLFACSHLILWEMWQRWRNRQTVGLLLKERWLYHSIAAVYFALYLTAIGVIYNRPDFQDTLFIPPHRYGALPVPMALLFSPLLWLWNWLVQVIAVMLPSALIPPAGIVIGHLRGMVEQALTTAPITQGSGMGIIVTALAVFWQGEATVVAMMWSGLLTRAVTAPHTFGTDSYWQAYKFALGDFLPLAKVVGVLTAMATALGMLT